MVLTHDAEALTPVRLRAVLAVADTASFSTAARAVGTSQSNVSRSVAAVESALGVALFDRSTRSVRLTDEGREFVERATLVVAELDATVRALQPHAEPAPRLTIACLTSVSELHLASAITAMGEGAVRFRCIEGLQATVEQAVVSGRADIGIGDLAQPHDDLATEPLWTEPIRLAVKRSHPLGRRRSLGLDDLAGEPLVGFSRDAELRTSIDRQLADARQLRTPDIVVDRFRTALSFVAAGLGVMALPAIATVELPKGVVAVPLTDREMGRTMGLLFRHGSSPTDRMRQLADHITASIADVDGVTLATR